jgi:hypothetical protein
MKGTVILKLEKEGEIQDITLNMGKLLQMAKRAARLNKLNREGWIVKEVSGSDTETVAFFQKIQQGYKPGASEMLAQAGLTAIPNILKKHFEKDKT